MGFVRRHRHCGGLLALAALALQIVLSFGHLHLDAVRRAFEPAAMAGAHVAVQSSADQRVPSPANDADDYCAICASIFLVSNSVTPGAPQLPVPAAFARIGKAIDVTRALVVEPPRAAFRSRAPPQA